MNIEDIDSLSEEELFELADLIEEYEQTHKLEQFKPYEYQRTFMSAGGKYKQRYLRAANRIGKTFCAAAEMSYHMTGLYPEWWEGDRITNSGWEYWCVGVDLKQVARVQQKELLGITKATMLDTLGTEAIPADCISTEGMRKHQDNVLSCFIQHTDGGYNMLRFFASAQGQNTLMGSSVKGIWIDEIPPYDPEEIYSQCYTRTATTKGFVLITATPEQGMTKIDKLFENDDKDLMYIQEASVYHAHENIGGHLDDDYIEGLKASTPEYMWPMRLHGKPAMGSGAVFPFKESDITYAPHEFDRTKLSLAINAGLDFGQTVDVSTIIFSFLDKETGIIYIDKEIYLNESVEARTPANMAKEILASGYPNVELIAPHDTGINSVNPESKARLLEQHGIWNLNKNKLPEELKSLSKQAGNNSSIAVRPGLDKMYQLFNDGKLKINTDCKHLLNEIRSYSYIEDGDGKSRPKGFNGDHAIDGARLSVMGHLRHVHSDLMTAMTAGAPRFKTDLTEFNRFGTEESEGHTDDPWRNENYEMSSNDW